MGGGRVSPVLVGAIGTIGVGGAGAAGAIPAAFRCLRESIILQLEPSATSVSHHAHFLPILSKTSSFLFFAVWFAIEVL